MKLKNILNVLCCFSMVLVSLVGCRRGEIVYSNAVATEYTTMTFAATGAEAQILPVYSDGYWSVECIDSWIDVKPLTGSGKMDITVTLKDNVDAEGVIDFPRQATIYFKSGSSSAACNASVLIIQGGDKYKGVEPVTIAQAKDLEAEDLAKFSRVQVKAASLGGIVVGDESGIMYIDGTKAGLKSGDYMTLAGAIKTLNGNKVVELDDEAAYVLESGETDYSSASDISSGIDTYAGNFLDLVSVKGSLIGLVNKDANILSGAAIHIPGATKHMLGVEAATSVGMAEANYHFVTIVGYYWGETGKNLSFIPAKIVEDGGVDKDIIPVPGEPNTILFADNFDWMEPFVKEAAAKGVKIDDSVADNNASGAAPNLYTTEGLESLAVAMQDKGYVDINADGKSIYPQSCYWKFGKTSVHTGLQLPPVDYYGDIDISFDWSPHMTGSGNIDKIILIVNVVTGSSVVKVAEWKYDTWQKGQMAWAHVSASAQITPESLIQIRPISLEDYGGITQQRFYLDNIVVKVPGPDIEPVEADIQVADDVVTFEGEGGEKILKISSSEDFVVKTRCEWLTLENTEGTKNTETDLVIKCEASTQSTLREAVITITSADSKKDIRVIQSAAGQDLDPFIAVAKNNVDVDCTAQKIDVNVQATEQYTVVPDVDWITVASEPTTKSLVLRETVTIDIAANEDTENGRVGHVVFAIPEKGVESVLTVTQAKAGEVSTVIFSDDFSWMCPIVEELNKSLTNPVSDFIYGTYADTKTRIDYSNNNSTNLLGLSGFADKLTAAGYTALNAGAKVMYAQGTAENAYLKFCKGNTQGGLSFQPFQNPVEEAEISLDWAVHMTNSALDVAHLQFKIEGAGTFENGTKVSEAFETGQKAVGDHDFTRSSAKIKNADATTVIYISNKEAFDANYAASGQHRFYIDNLLVEKVK